MTRTAAVAISGTALLLLAGCTAATASASPFETALDACHLNEGLDAKLRDEGATLTLNGKGDRSGGLNVESISCVLTELDVPYSVIARIDETRALDGRQEAAWGDVVASWTYHPDDGPDFILEYRPN